MVCPGPGVRLVICYLPDRKIAKGPVTHTTPQYPHWALTGSNTRVALAFEAHGCLSSISVGTRNLSLAIQVFQLVGERPQLPHLNLREVGWGWSLSRAQA
jgi:hypothetical protein